MVGMPASLEHAIAATAPLVEESQRILERCREDGDFQPVFFVFTTRRGVDVLGMHWTCPEEKDVAAVAMRLAAAAAQPLGLWGVMLITDSREWEVDADFLGRVLGLSREEAIERVSDDLALLQKYSRPRDCLLVTLETYLGDYQARLRYDRAPSGRVTWHPPLLQPASQQSEGRFVNLLPPLPSSEVCA